MHNWIKWGEAMKISASQEVINSLKIDLEKTKNGVVRIKISGYGWGGPSLGVALDEQKTDDIIYELKGVKFAASEDISYLIENAEILKIAYGYRVRRNLNC